MSSDSDHGLMESLLREDPGSLERIIAKWERPLYSFAYRYTQSDFTTREIVQETFVRVFTKRARFDFKYPLSSWIFTIAANLCKNRTRWQKRHPEVSIDASAAGDGGEPTGSLIDVLPADEALPAEHLEHDEELDSLKNAVMDLPHDLRTAILLHHYEELSYKEIADIVGCSARGVETRLYRARKLLKGRLAAKEDCLGEPQKKTASVREAVGELSPYPAN